MSTTFQIITASRFHPEFFLPLTIAEELIWYRRCVHVFSRRELRFEATMEKAHRLFHGKSKGKSDNQDLFTML